MIEHRLIFTEDEIRDEAESMSSNRLNGLEGLTVTNASSYTSYDQTFDFSENELMKMSQACPSRAASGRRRKTPARAGNA